MVARHVGELAASDVHGDADRKPRHHLERAAQIKFLHHIEDDSFRQIVILDMPRQQLRPHIRLADLHELHSTSWEQRLISVSLPHIS